MSSQKGNSSRSRPQKYQNAHAFKNNLHDTSHRTKAINNIQVANVCKRCKGIIEWKIKYKKYKPLKAPSKCTKCDQKCVKHAYHTMCEPCALKLEVCPKCGEKTEIIKSEVKEETLTLDRELRLLLKKLPERKRRTFYRYMKRGNKSKQKEEQSDNDAKQLNEEEKKLITDESKILDQVVLLTREDLLAKLQALIMASERKKDNDEDDDCDYDSEDAEFDDFCTKMNKDVNKDSINEKSAVTPTEKSPIITTEKSAATPTEKSAVTPTEKSPIITTEKSAATPTEKSAVTPTEKSPNNTAYNKSAATQTEKSLINTTYEKSAVTICEEAVVTTGEIFAITMGQSSATAIDDQSTIPTSENSSNFTTFSKYDSSDNIMNAISTVAQVYNTNKGVRMLPCNTAESNAVDYRNDSSDCGDCDCGDCDCDCLSGCDVS